MTIILFYTFVACLVVFFFVPSPGCEQCGSMAGCFQEPSRTMYHWSGEGEDPNRDRRLCRACAAEHHDYWDGMWDDYYGMTTGYHSHYDWSRDKGESWVAFAGFRLGNKN